MQYMKLYGYQQHTMPSKVVSGRSLARRTASVRSPHRNAIRGADARASSVDGGTIYFVPGLFSVLFTGLLQQRFFVPLSYIYIYMHIYIYIYIYTY